MQAPQIASAQGPIVPFMKDIFFSLHTAKTAVKNSGLLGVATDSIVQLLDEVCSQMLELEKKVAAHESALQDCLASHDLKVQQHQACINELEATHEKKG